MHTTDFPSCTFIHNGDFSGEVIIRKKPPARMPALIGDEIAVDGKDILAMAAEIIRSRKIATLESASTDQILNGEV